MTKSCNYGTIYADSASDHVWCAFQTSKEAKETIDGYHEFENICKTIGVDVKAHRVDNCTCNSNIFRNSCVTFRQGITFSGVNARHQNSVTKRKIGCVENLARTLVFHAIMSWLSRESILLWPLDIKHTIYIHTATRNNSGVSHAELPSGCKSSVGLSKCHVLGSPNL